MDINSIIIRNVEPHERLKVAELWEAMHREISPEKSPSKDWWIFKTGHASIFVLECDREFIGFFDIWYDVDPLCETHKMVMNDVYLKPDYRKSGVFKLLCDFVRKEGKINKASAIAGFCKENKRKFWEHVGFKMTGYTMELEL